MSTKCTSMTLAGVQCTKSCKGSLTCHLHTVGSTADVKKKTVSKKPAAKKPAAKKPVAKKSATKKK